MSKPILGVDSVFALIASWKDFLWPLLVLTDPNKHPLSVRLPAIQSQTWRGRPGRDRVGRDSAPPGRFAVRGTP
jgi:ABC-type glycerol-3-phosphate transport system permease component